MIFKGREIPSGEDWNGIQFGDEIRWRFDKIIQNNAEMINSVPI